ncbi:MAG: CHAT domain-containing protein [Cyanobacteria bacterium]|nr:CHAT domain-containing protein [Cyanobacteriota bacterium]
MIGGGSPSADGVNLFHSFSQFDLPAGSTAIFQDSPGIQNILGRIGGDRASQINGLLRSDGGARLFLINPAGLIFGDGAVVSVGGSFVATTASGVRFGDGGWFSAVGANEYARLTGAPDALAFPSANPGGLIHTGALRAGALGLLPDGGAQVALIGGAVVSTGAAIANGGPVSLVGVPGGQGVILRPVGSILGIEVVPSGNFSTLPNGLGFEPLALPVLLTGEAGAIATGLEVNDQGQVVLVEQGQATAIAAGTVVVAGEVGGDRPGAIVQLIGTPVVDLREAPEPLDPSGAADDDDPPRPRLPFAPEEAIAFDPELEDGGDMETDAGGGFLGNGPLGEFEGPDFDGFELEEDGGNFGPGGEFEGDGADGPLADGPFEDGPLAEGPLEDGPLADGPLEDGPLADGPLEDEGEAGDRAFDGPLADGDFDPSALGGELDLDLDFSDAGAWLAGEFDRGVGLLELGREQQLSQFFERDWATETNNVGDIRDRLAQGAADTQTNTALVYVVLQRDRLETITITAQGEPAYHSVPIDRETVLATARQFRAQLTNPLDLDREPPSYLAASQRLYRWIIQPMLATLRDRGVDTLLLSPGEGLRLVPYAALHSGQGFLVEEFAIATTPSINLTDTRYSSIRDAPVLAMGASQFEALPPLPAVPLELRTIARSLPPILDQNFTIAALQTQRRETAAPILHLATHGEFNGTHPAESYIQFWGNERITLDRLADLQLNDPPLELLVLSACRTAIGDQRNELGFAGLAVQAGVKSSLASLWSVSDAGTLAFMAEFYQQRTQTTTKAKALQATQRAVIQGQVAIAEGRLVTRGAATPIDLPNTRAAINLRHPYYWSGFSLVGSPW